MIAYILDLAQVWRNPVFIRFCRSRLRFRKAIFWYLLTVIVATFGVTLTYIIRTNSGTSGEVAARGLWIPLIIFQGLILMVKGTGAAAAGLIQDKIDQTLDYQRLTPMSPMKNILGYLYGLPVLEYLMVALTLPHLLFIVIVGNIPIGTLVSVYFAFFVCVTLYHMTGVAVGMVMKKWIWGYLLSIFMVVIVNLILPTLISQFGLKFLQYLSVWPVIGQKVLPLTVSPQAMSFVTQNPFFSGAADVQFYSWSLSAFTFTMMMQGTLLLTFALMALRRWKSSTMHSLSKPYSLALLTGIIVVLLGNVWPAITGQFLPFPIFGETNLESISEAIAVGFPMVFSFMIWLLCLVLFAMIVPSHHAYVRGVRRAIKMGKKAANPWDDDSGSVAFMMLFVLVMLAGFSILISELISADFFDFATNAGTSLWRLPVAIGLVVTYTLLLMQVMQLRPTVLIILLLWFLPILVAIVLGASTDSFETPHSVIASLSPIALVTMSGLVPLMGAVPLDVADEFDTLMNGVHFGLVFVTIQIAYLANRWRGLKRSFQRACEPDPGAAAASEKEGLAI